MGVENKVNKKIAHLKWLSVGLLANSPKNTRRT